MDSKHEDKQPEQTRRDDPPPTPAKKRFRIEKLEERIAPKKGGNHSSIDSSASSGFSSGVSYY
jgi:hypothetical protein